MLIRPQRAETALGTRALLTPALQPHWFLQHLVSELGKGGASIRKSKCCRSITYVFAFLCP